MGKNLHAVAQSARGLVADLYLDTARFLNEPMDGVPDTAAEAAFELNYACAMTSESALLLLMEDHVWDADILARSVVEGTLKGVYLLLGTDDEMRSRADEFFEVVPGCQALVRLDRAQKLLDIVEDRNAPEWAAVREVVEVDLPVAEKTRSTSRAGRGQVQRQWSFTGLVESLAQLPGLEPIAVLGFAYGLQSHLVHKDSNATGMMYERSERSPLRRDAALDAHGARIVSDIVDMAHIRASLAARVSAADTRSLSSLGTRMERLAGRTKSIEMRFRRIEYPDSSPNS